MGKGKSPAREELEFIYGLIVGGASDREVLDKYEELGHKGQLGYFPKRNDVRFIRQRRKEFEAARSILEERFTSTADPILAKIRLEHWSDLSNLAARFESFWKASEDLPSGGYYGMGWIVEEPQLEQIDAHLAAALLCHLKAEFPALEGIMDWRDLLQMGVGRDAIDALVQVARRRTFTGTCMFCKSW